MKDVMRDELGVPRIVDRSTFQADRNALRVREKVHTRDGDVPCCRPPTSPHGGGGRCCIYISG
jgi:hypothetical protein